MAATKLPPLSASPINVWILNQTGVPQELNTKVTRAPPELQPPAISVPSSKQQQTPAPTVPQPPAPPAVLANGNSADKSPVSENIRSTIKHGNINYQPTRTNTFLNKTKSKEAKSRAVPVTGNHNLMDLRNTVPVTTSTPVRRATPGIRKSKTYIPSSPVSHTSFVFQDLDPNIINGHKPSARLSPRRFYSDYPAENRVLPPGLPVPKPPPPPPMPPYDKICGGDEQVGCPEN